MDVMPVLASAPGKLVLSGEYAVLEGAPAVVVAVNRRAQVRMCPSGLADWCMHAPDIGIQDARFRLDAAGQPQWSQREAGRRTDLGLVAAVLVAFAQEWDTVPMRIELDTRAFVADDADRSKLGLGSSAALAVALSGAVCALRKHGAPELADLRRVHAQAQGGRGSGLDVAASLRGGMLTYRVTDTAAAIATNTWPAGLEMCCIWSGRPARTGTFLQHLASWRAQNEAAFAARMRDLSAVAEFAARAVSDGNIAVLLDALAACAKALDSLGADSGLDIVCAEHRAIGALARACGVVYKTSGAGGGDVGLAVSNDADRLHRFRQRVCAAGFVPLDLAPDSCGLRVRSTDQDTKRNIHGTP